MSTEVLLNEFKECSEHPYRVISAYKQEGKKVIGVLPYLLPWSWSWPPVWCPWASGGSNKKTIAMDQGVLRHLLLHHRPAGAGDAAGRHLDQLDASSPPPSVILCGP